MTYTAVDFLVEGMWAWPPDWDGESDFLVFDCPALWFDLNDLKNIRKGTVTVDFGCQFIDDDVVAAVSYLADGRRCIWKLSNQYDPKNNARLMVWPD